VGVNVEEFISANYERVRRALTVALNDPARAEELTQEAFAQAWRRWHSVAEMERPVAWVYVVAMNRMRREFGREQRREAIAERMVRPAAAMTPDPAQAVVTSLTLQSALRDLSTRQRAAVVLHYLADLTVPEVAAAMRCAEGTVKSTLHTALARLQIELVKDEEP
jgi:RNA polymerase sigma-70 factor (ECF subfamily)